MENKLLVGVSAIAVVVLVLASLSPVVGYHSVKSTSVKDSPLFNIRTSRAIQKDSNELMCNYVGKGKLMPFPARDSNSELFQKFVSSIAGMNKHDFDRFIGLVANRLKNDNAMKDENIAELIYALSRLRTNPSEISDYLSDEKNGNRTKSDWYTSEGAILWCIFLFLFEIFFGIFFFIFSNIYVKIQSIKSPTFPTVCDYDACLTYMIGC